MNLIINSHHSQSTSNNNYESPITINLLPQQFTDPITDFLCFRRQVIKNHDSDVVNKINNINDLSSDNNWYLNNYWYEAVDISLVWIQNDFLYEGLSNADVSWRIFWSNYRNSLLWWYKNSNK